MLTSRERLAARQGQSGTPRHEYLQELVSEYARSQHWLRKEEIVANLANFAYDPINYAALRQLRVIELFVEIISVYGENDVSTAHEDNAVEMPRRDAADRESVSKSKRLLVEFALGGICNCIPDPALQVAFVASHGVAAVLKIIMQVHVDEEPSALNTSLSALTTAYFLLDSLAFLDVTSESVMAHMTALSHHSNTRISNIAKAYRSRYAELLASASDLPPSST